MDLPPFKWDSKHQESFDRLKDALISSPILAYPNYDKPFILETDASLKGLGAVLSQEDEDGKFHIISYASCMPKPYERSMQKYSSAKLELLALKWAICDKFRDYLIGSWFTMLTDNNPLTYVRISCLGAAQIRWLSDLMLFDFEIKYRDGKTNQAADALSQWPGNPDSSSESLDGEEEWVTISYEMVCQIFDHHLNSANLPYHVKHEIRTNIRYVEMANSTINLQSTNVINAQLQEVKLFSSIMPKQMVVYQKKDFQLSLVYDKVSSNLKPELSEVHCVQSKPICRLLLQFNQLSSIQGVLHHHTFKDDYEIQQLILPQQFCKPILKSLHDDNSHQGQQRMLSLLQDKVYWPSMYRDTDHWLYQCERCLISKGNYTEPKTRRGNLTAQQSLKLLCIDFMKADIAKGGKENILVLTDAFSKYSQAIITNNQKALMVAKILVEKWFCVFRIPARIHSDQGRSFDNEIIGHLCKMYGIKQSTTMPYNPRGNSQCEQFNHTLFGLR